LNLVLFPPYPSMNNSLFTLFLASPHADLHTFCAKLKRFLVLKGRPHPLALLCLLVFDAASTSLLEWQSSVKHTQTPQKTRKKDIPYANHNPNPNPNLNPNHSLTPTITLTLLTLTRTLSLTLAKPLTLTVPQLKPQP
jgi:hypothetical protein